MSHDLLTENLIVFRSPGDERKWPANVYCKKISKLMNSIMLSLCKAFESLTYLKIGLYTKSLHVRVCDFFSIYLAYDQLLFSSNK
jgi:hypothetical protein